MRFFSWLRGLFGRPKPRSSREALEAWNKDFRSWLDSLQTVFAAFPDHAVLEGQPLDEQSLKLLDEIAQTYMGEACKAVSAFELRAERLRRHLEAEQQRLPPRAVR